MAFAVLIFSEGFVMAMEYWELPGPFGDPGLMKNHHLELKYGNINPPVIIVALNE